MATFFAIGGAAEQLVRYVAQRFRRRAVGSARPELWMRVEWREDRFEGIVAGIIQMNVKGKRLAARTAAARQARFSDALSA